MAQAEKKKIIPQRIPMAEQEPSERVRNFREVPHGYTPQEAIAEANRCLLCKKAVCVSGCPVAIDIPKFIHEIAAGDFRGAYRTLRHANSLPAVCGRVCPQEDQCEAVCTLCKKYEPVSIGRLERFAADWALEHFDDPLAGAEDAPNPPRANGKPVAVVGAGPAGLTAAADLRRLGHHVVVFEALHEAGGVLTYGIPEFRLPREVLQRELGLLTGMGVEICCNHVIGQTLTVDELLQEFAAVFLATGAGLPYFMGVPGENSLGVYSANEFLTRVNLLKAYLFPQFLTPIKVGRRVAVIGAGNTAMDAARTARRLPGVEEVTIVYRRSRQEMPARLEEIRHAEEEGVRFELLQAPTRIFANSEGWVEAMEVIRMELGEPDASGRRRPLPVKGSEFVMPVDTIVVAVGQASNPLIAQTTQGLQVTKNNNIVVDPETLMSSRPGVFAGGDVVTGGATVILAMGAGRKAAAAIHAYVQDQD